MNLLVKYILPRVWITFAVIFKPLHPGQYSIDKKKIVDWNITV